MARWRASADLRIHSGGEDARLDAPVVDEVAGYVRVLSQMSGESPTASRRQ
jgi:hypothetical protein